MTTKVSNELLDNPAGHPLTTKGDLFTHDGSVAVRLPAGAPGRALVYDPATPTGLNAVAFPSGNRIVGELLFAGFAGTPAGFLPCDGAAINRVTYAALLTAIGTTWGAGNGSTTFNVPDFRGRSPMGTGTGILRLVIVSIDPSNPANLFTVPSTDLQTGAAVVYTSTAQAHAPLVSGTTYYWIRVTATTGKLATSRANAIAGTWIDLSTAPGDLGTGTQALQVNLTARTVGQQLGEENHSLTVAELASHLHTKGFGPGGANAAGESGFGTDNTAPAGGSGEHYNVHPAAVVGVFIYTGV